MAGYNTNGLAAATVAAGTFPLTGNEALAVDTNLSSGVSPQQESVTLGQLVSLTAPVALTDAASILTDASLGHSFSVTLGGNRALANPTNLQAGRTYRWVITQDGTGTRLLTFGTLFTFDSGGSTISTAAGYIDIITGFYDGTKLRCGLAKHYA